MTGGTAEVHQPSFGEKNDSLAIGEFDFIDLWLDVDPLVVLQGIDLNLSIKVADVADDGAVFHGAHVLDRDDVDVTCGGDENISNGCGIIHRGDLKPFHRCL